MENARQLETRKSGNAKVYKIYTIVEKPGNEKSIWLDIGVGRQNRDESITCKLDCLPLNGVIQIRPHDGRKPNNFSNGPAEGSDRNNDGGYRR